MQFRIFLSAVSSEFASVRDDLFKQLEKHGFDVTYQEKLVPKGDADRTLDKVYAYFQECDLIIYLVGQRSGGFPAEKVAAKYANLLPKGWKRASYTQWEYFFCHAPRADGKPRHRFFFFAEGYDEHRPNVKGESGAAQTRFIKHLKHEEGHDRTSFTSDHHLFSQIKDQPWFKQALPRKPNNLPYPSIGTLFVGRETFMHDLRKSIEAQAQAVIKPRHSIHGLGGLGKTRLATEYAWQHQTHYSALLFVIAESREALRRNLAALCGPLVLNLPENDAREEDVKVAAALRWLQQHEGWFLLVDNVDSPEAVSAAEELLGPLANGHVVYTSRLSNWAAHVKPLELDVLDEDVSTRFILERTAQKRRPEADAEAQARLIARDVDGLALALEQACAYINQRRLTLAGYRQAWNEKHDEVLKWYDAQVMNYPKSVAVTWQTSLDQLSADAKELLMRLAWLSPEPIPESLLDVRAGEDDTLDAHTALAELERFSLITRDNEGPFFSVHRLVQDVTSRQQLHGRIGAALRQATTWFCEALDVPAQDVQAHRRLQHIYPHALQLCDRGETLDLDGAFPFLLTQVSDYLINYASDYRRAEILTRRVLALRLRRYGMNHLETFTAMNNLAQVLRRLSRTEEAEELLRGAIAGAMNIEGPEGRSLASFYSNLGLLFTDTDRSEEACAVLRKALLVSEQRFGPDSADAARCAHNLAEALACQGERTEAEHFARKAIRAIEGNGGTHSIAYSAVLNCLARLLPEPGEESVSLLRQALAIRRALLPPDHPDLSVALNNLGEFLLLLGQTEEAEALLREQLALLARASERNRAKHPQLQRALRTYVRCSQVLGRTAKNTEEIVREIIRASPIV